jgi:hypothetical protein
MQTRYDLNGLFLLVLLSAATAAEAQLQPDLDKRYFEEATKLCGDPFGSRVLPLRSE